MYICILVSNSVVIMYVVVLIINIATYMCTLYDLV